MTNEKRLQALAELQEDGERMEKFDLDKESWHEAKKMKSLVDYGLTCCGSDLYKAGFNKALDLVMEKHESLLKAYPETSFHPNHTAWQIFDDLKPIISKLRGQK